MNRLWAGWILGAALLGSCATVPDRPASLQVSITPAELHPGDVVTLRVSAPPGTRSVRGRLDLPGSPVLDLRSRDDGQTWGFTTQVPLTVVWKPGTYRVIVEAVGPEGEPLQGQTSVTAW